MSSSTALHAWNGNGKIEDMVDRGFVSGYNDAINDVLNLCGGLIGPTLRQQIARLANIDEPVGN